MTDRLKGFIVTLDKDYREDDAETIVSAIRMVKGVLTVKPVRAGIDDEMNRDRILRKLREKIWKALEDDRS